MLHVDFPAVYEISFVYATFMQLGTVTLVRILLDIDINLQCT